MAAIRASLAGLGGRTRRSGPHWLLAGVGGVAPPGPDGVLFGGAPAEVDFRVERACKGSLGDQVTVHTVASGATCGIEAPTGERVGLFLQRRTAGGWTSSLCSMTDPDALAEAAKDLPRPTGRGPVRFLLGGAFGKPSVIALDRQGHALAYGAGSGSVTGLEVCPGGRRSLETAWVIRSVGQFGLLTWVDGADLVARASESFGPAAPPLSVLDAGFDRCAACAASTGHWSPPARPGGSALATVGGATRVSARARQGLVGSSAP